MHLLECSPDHISLESSLTLNVSISIIRSYVYCNSDYLTYHCTCLLCFAGRRTQCRSYLQTHDLSMHIEQNIHMDASGVWFQGNSSSLRIILSMGNTKG